MYTKGLVRMRKRAKLKQQELADLLNVERSTVAKWEIGAAYPRASQLPALAKALQCSIDDLYEEGSTDESTQTTLAPA
jgi:transcriptional regulator with XRE-family HTH domain